MYLGAAPPNLAEKNDELSKHHIFERTKTGYNLYRPTNEQVGTLLSSLAYYFAEIYSVHTYGFYSPTGDDFFETYIFCEIKSVMEHKNQLEYNKKHRKSKWQ